MLRLTLLLAMLCRAPASAQDVAAVLPAAPGPYGKAFAAFLSSFGGGVAVYRLPAPFKSPYARVVVAFGGEAAVRPYPERATVIACVCPGLGSRSRRPGRFVFIAMRPSASKLLAEMRRLQPGLKRLAALMNGPVADDYLAELRRAGAPLGIEIVAPPTDGREGLPGALRSLLTPKADAVWLAPDPVLVTPENFRAIAQFSADNAVPFYGPTRDLAAAGAAVSIWTTPEEQGRLAADLARKALAGEALPQTVYPEKTETTVNAGAARKAGLSLDLHRLAGVEVLP